MESWSVITELAPCLHRFLTMREESRSLFVALLRLVQGWRHSWTVFWPAKKEVDLFWYDGEDCILPAKKEIDLCSWHCSSWYNGEDCIFYQQRRKQISVRFIAQVGTMVRTLFMTSRERSRSLFVALLRLVQRWRHNCILIRREGSRFSVRRVRALLRLVQRWRHNWTVFLTGEKEADSLFVVFGHCSGWYKGDAILGLYSKKERRKQILSSWHCSCW